MRSPGDRTESPSPPQYSDIYTTPSDIWRLIRDARRARPPDRFAILFLDIRSPEEFAKGHILGPAVNVDPEILRGFARQLCVLSSHAG